MKTIDELEARLDAMRAPAYANGQMRSEGCYAMAVYDLWSDYLRAIGRRYRSCELENFEITEDAQQLLIDTLTAVRAHLAEHIVAGRNLVLVGPAGTGKDHLLTALAREACRLRLRVKWSSGPQLFAAARDAIDKGTSESELVRQYTLPAVLVLSDPVPPSRVLTDFQADLLYRIIDERYRRVKPTWASINLAAGESDKALGAQVADRLRDGAIVLRCSWATHRTPHWTPKA